MSFSAAVLAEADALTWSMGVVDEIIVDDNDVDAEEDKYDDNVGDATLPLPPRVDKNDQRWWWWQELWWVIRKDRANTDDDDDDDEKARASNNTDEEKNAAADTMRRVVWWLDNNRSVVVAVRIDCVFIVVAREMSFSSEFRPATCLASCWWRCHRALHQPFDGIGRDRQLAFSQSMPPLWAERTNE